MENSFVSIGQIGRPFNYDGRVRVISLTDFPERFVKAGKVYVRKEGHEQSELTVEKATVQGRQIILKFAGIDTKEAVQLWQGATIEIAKDQVMPLPADSYYFFDLVGSQVSSSARGTIGTVTEVLRLASNDVLAVEQNGREIMVPLVKDAIKSIDIARKKIEINDIKGLLD